MSMSAEIIRNLVSACFNVPATQVILSGVMPQHFELEEDHSSGNAYTHDKNHAVYGFEPVTGFVEIPGDMSGKSSNANGTWNNEKRTSFSHITEHSSALFFLVVEDNRARQEGSQDIDERKVTLYKAPDVKAIIASIEQADIDRWKQWLQ